MASKKNKSKSDIIFESINYLFLILLCITTLYPFIYLVTLSLSSNQMSMGNFQLILDHINFDSYTRVFESIYIVSGFKVTIIRTVLGSFLNLLIIVCTAYPLSKKFFPNRSFWTGVIVFTMFFSGGLIPNYMLMKQLNLLNSMWSLILPGLVPTFSMIIVRNFFMTIPDSLEESAKIDGANDIRILFSIILPVSKSILATISLWVAVAHWNAWFDSMIYIQDTNKQVLQVVLRRIVLEGTQQLMDTETSIIDDSTVVTPEGIKAATTIITTLPILVVYPFLQKYFVKGIMVGSLKG